MCGIGSKTDFSHIFEMLDDANMRSGLNPLFHIALLNDFGSFALCMSDRLFDSAHMYTASPLFLNFLSGTYISSDVKWCDPLNQV